MKETSHSGIGRLPLLPLIRILLTKKEFFDDYHIREYGNHWDGMYNIQFPHLNSFRGDGYNFYKMAFYSDEFTNFPLSLDLTGKSEDFKITITDS